MSKAVVFFAECTEECEALLVVDLLRRAKALHGGAPVETPCARPVPRVQQSVACVAAAAMEGGRSCPS